MDIKSANFGKMLAALAVLGVVGVGTYAVRSGLHRHSTATADVRKSEIVVLAAAPPQQVPKASTTIPERVFWGAAHNHTELLL